MRDIVGYEGVKLIDAYCCKSHHVKLFAVKLFSRELQVMHYT
jgi:hypothetical protein